MKASSILSKILLLLVLNFFLYPAKNAWGIVLKINNNFSEEDSGALIEISEVEGIGIRPALKVFIMPGENKQISPKNLTGFTLSRVFGSFKERYKISCDPNASKKLKVTLNYENILKNDLPVGCSLESQGSWTSAEGNKWIKKPLKEVNYFRSQENDFIFN